MDTIRSDELSCYRCGESLSTLSLPLSRRDECPHCSVYLHVCRMCRFYDPAVPAQCREDDAEEVIDKTRANYCEWFKPDPGAHDAGALTQERRAKDELDVLFGDADEPGSAGDPALKDAEDLFK